MLGNYAFLFLKKYWFPLFILIAIVKSISSLTLNQSSWALVSQAINLDSQHFISPGKSKFFCVS